VCEPPRPPVLDPVTVYHAQPYGLRDGLRRRVYPGLYVDISGVVDEKRAMLAEHRSQQDWLDVSQGLNAYLETMVDMSAEMGRLSGCFASAEGWRRHLHLGFCDADDDPLRQALGEQCRVNEDYERGLG